MCVILRAVSLYSLDLDFALPQSYRMPRYNAKRECGTLHDPRLVSSKSDCTKSF